MCSTDFCPLYKSMMTNNNRMKPLIIYAQNKDKERIPLQTTVTPLYNKNKEVIGGLELFRLAKEDIKEFETAQKIQLQLVGKNLKYLTKQKKLDARYLYVSSDMLGGDFLDVFEISDDEYLIAMADVVGHGVSAALITGMIKSIITSSLKKGIDLGDYIKKIESNFLKYRLTEMYFTLLLGYYSKKENSLELINAGHTYPIIFSEGKMDVIDIKGPAIGWGLNFLEYERKKIFLKNGDMLLLYTDGVYGFLDTKDKLYSENDFYEYVQSIQGLPKQLHLNKIYYNIFNNAKKADELDDIALFAISF